MAAFAFSSRIILSLMIDAIRVLYQKHGWWTSLDEWLFFLFYRRQAEFYREFAYFLIAFWLTSRWAGIKSSSVLDAREWSGRIFSVIVVVWAITWVFGEEVGTW